MVIACYRLQIPMAVTKVDLSTNCKIICEEGLVFMTVANLL